MVPLGAAPKWAWGKEKRKKTLFQVGWGLEGGGRAVSGDGAVGGRSEQPSRTQLLPDPALQPAQPSPRGTGTLGLCPALFWLPWL